MAKPGWVPQATSNFQSQLPEGRKTLMHILPCRSSEPPPELTLGRRVKMDAVYFAGQVRSRHHGHIRQGACHARYSGIDTILERADAEVRQRSGKEAVPIIAIGNDSGGFREGQAYQRGANLFIAKPVALDALVEGLEKLANLMPRDDQS